MEEQFTLTLEKLKEIYEVIDGITFDDWNSIKREIDRKYSQKSSTIKFDKNWE